MVVNILRKSCRIQKLSLEVGFYLFPVGWVVFIDALDDESSCALVFMTLVEHFDMIFHLLPARERPDYEERFE